MLPQTQEWYIPVDNRYNKNINTHKVFVTHFPYVRKWEENDLLEDGNNTIWFDTIHLNRIHPSLFEYRVFLYHTSYYRIDAS